MEYIYLGIALFFGAHLISASPLKAGLQKPLGVNGYKGLYSLVSAAGIGLMIYGKSKAIHFDLFSGFSDLRTLAIGLMWLAFVLMTAYLVPSNIKRLSRHPMLLSVSCWAIAHLLVNGDKASMLIFGSFLAYSIFAMVMQTMRSKKKKGKKTAPAKDVIVVIVGTVLFAVTAVFLHEPLFGVALR